MIQPVVLRDVFFDTTADIADEVVRIGFGGQFGSHHVRMGLVFLQGVFQQAFVTELLTFQILAEYLKQVQWHGIDIGSRTFQLFLELHHLFPHRVFLRCGILVYMIVVEYIAIRFLEFRAVQVFIQLFDTHIRHSNFCLMSLIS